MSLGQEGGRNAPVVDVQFDRPTRRYDPGGRLMAHYRILGLEPGSVRAVEASVAWYTEGKGEEDLVVHAFERAVGREALAVVAEGGAIDTQLPLSPLSYEGVIVKIRWCARVRVFYAGGRDYVSEHVFEVGSLPPIRCPVPPADAS